MYMFSNHNKPFFTIISRVDYEIIKAKGSSIHFEIKLCIKYMILEKLEDRE